MIDLLTQYTGPKPEELETVDDIDTEDEPDIDDIDVNFDDAEPDFSDDDDVDADPDTSFEESDGIEDYEKRPLRAKRAPARKPARSRKKPVKKAPEDIVATWNRLCKDASGDAVHAYKITQKYKRFDVIRHPKFGTGYVRDIRSQTKVEVVFEDGPKKLVCNLPD